MNLTGQILVSMPSLEDERFFKTVIYMCAHSSEGSMGIIINKIDSIDDDKLEKIKADVSKYYNKDEVFYISALTRQGIDILRKKLFKSL